VCGRYATSRTPDELVEEFRVEATSGLGPGDEPLGLTPSYNVAPTEAVPVVLTRRPRTVEGTVAQPREGGGERDDEESEAADATTPDATTPDATTPGTTAADRDELVEVPAVRWLRLLRWGLVPSWAPDRRGAARMINARAETLLDKTFRRAALARRCLVPADGWYEWQLSPVEHDKAGKPRKQPFFMHPQIGGGLAFAGIYEFWRDDVVHPDDQGAWVTTFAIVTVAAEPGLARVHDRMPLVLAADDWDDWLDPTVTEPDAVRALLVPPVAGRFATRPVSTLVNSVANKGAELVAEVLPDHLRGVVDPVTGELIGRGDEPLF
jgi:putative SOS response-associated peptidase YedK